MRRDAELARRQQAIATAAEELVGRVLALARSSAEEAIEIPVGTEPAQLASELAQEIGSYVYRNCGRLAPTLDALRRLERTFIVTSGGERWPLLGRRKPPELTAEERQRQFERAVEVTDQVRESLEKQGIGEQDILEDFERFRSAHCSS